MKLIHCADLHLGSSLTSHFDAVTAKKRRDELFKTFQKMLEYASKNEVDAVLIAGDLFDHDHVSATLKRNVYDVIKQYPALSFYYLRGNHDCNIDYELKPDNLYLFDHQWKSYHLNEVVVTGVEIDDNNLNNISQELQLDASDYNIVMMHGQIVESKQKTGDYIYLNELKNHFIDYLALGHIHTYQFDQLDQRGNYCYSGCLEGRGFDECGKHGFVLLEVNNHQCKHTFVPFASREIFHEQIDISSCDNQIQAVNLIREYLKQLNHHQEDYIEIILTGNIPVDCEIDLSFMKTQLEDEFSFMKIKDHTDIQMNYEDYIEDSTLKGEFIRQVMNDQNDEERKAKIIQLGLDVLSRKKVKL